MSAPKILTVTPQDAGQRLDRWVRKQVPELGFGQVQKLMRKGAIRLDGSRVKGAERLAAGSEVRIPALDPPTTRPMKKPARPTLGPDQIEEVRGWVLFRNDDLIALNKPPGLPTQGGTGVRRHLDGLLDALRFDAPERPRLVHRLDKDTSGVILVARSAAAARWLTTAFRAKTADKRYLAVVVGAPRQPGGRLESRIGKQGGAGHEKMAMTADGKPAVTDYEMLDKAADKAALLALKPLTGRTHQLRLHCAELGHPIVGDGKYGGKDAFLSGTLSRKLHLHSRFIELETPAGARLHLEAPLPDHMAETVAMLGLEADGPDPFTQEDAVEKGRR
ncbi:RluA family pseudouridine synthase [Yunchengibacter salinarum]|uniref:RluA family pseudouridine synthase n=1 Tax=Yunchengibacter salinarum TaxID=3133399 RepID=UPI0035B57FA4